MQKHLKTHWQPVWVFLVIGIMILACGRTTVAIQPAAAQPTSNGTAQSGNVPTAAPPSNGQAQSGSILFRDDFQDGQPQDWSIKSAWNVEQFNDVYLFGTSGLGTANVTRGGSWTDYTLQTSARVNKGNLLLSINLSKQGRYSLRLGTDGVFLLKESPAGKYNVLSEAGPITAKTWHQVSFASQSGHLQVSIDKVLWFDYNDTAPITQGTIGVSALDGARVFVDNVLVTKNQGALPSGVAQAPPPVNNAPSESQVIEEQADIQPPGDIQSVGEEPVSIEVSGNQPDLVVSEVTFTPSPVIQGQPFTANYIIENRGGGDAGAFTFSLHFHANAGIADCNMDVASLASGEAAWGDCSRQINGNTGNYPVEATADIEGEINESDENNNTSSLGLLVAITDSGGEVESEDNPEDNPADNSEGGQPDLVVTNVEFSPNPAIQGQPFTANFSIRNQGTGTSAPFTFRLHFHASAGLADCNFDVNSFGPGESVSSDCTRQINGNTGNYPVKATVDVEGEIAESDEGNNVLDLTLPVAGAPDGDGNDGGQPDMVVISIEIYSDTKLLCTVQNAGQGEAPTGIQVALFVGSGFQDRQGVSSAVPAGAPAGVFFNMDTTQHPFTAKCKVDYTEIVQESNEGNNEMELTFP
jgi:hypothetical protein